MSLRFLIPVCFVFLQSFVFAQYGMSFRQDAVERLRKGEYIEALEYLNLAIKKEPSGSELYYLRGYAKYGLDDFLGAEQDYSRSIDLSPYLADVFTNRAIVRTQLQNFTGAMEDFDRALEMDGTNGEIWFHRARTNLFLKKTYSCIVDCNKAIELNFRNESVYILKSSAEVEIKRFSEAIEDLDQAKKINSKNGYIYSQRGLVWVELNKNDSAIADFSHAISLDSVNTFAIFNRALVSLKIPDQASALKDLNTVIRISPYNSYAYYNRAIVLIGIGETRKAIRDFEIVSKLDPKNIVSYFYRSKLKTELKDYQGALADLDKTIELLPEYTDAWYDRYELKLKMNDRKGAQADYNQALELTRNNHQDPDSLKAERKDYLKNLVKLSGDFEQMNSMNSKLQNQAIDIQPKSMFSILLWKADFGKVKLYDVYKKTHYPANILSLTNQSGVISDSVLLKEIDDQTHMIDSAGNSSGPLYKRAVTWIQLRNFDNALHDLNSLLASDSGNVTALFSRAGTRYEIIQQLAIQEDLQREITIGKMLPKTQHIPAQSTVEHTYELVIADYDRALALDPEFAFAWFNRGYVNSRMGNYRDAVNDFSKALSLREDLAEAWYNRGLVSIILNENHNGCKDLSHAGELGVTDAYRVMKRYCYK